MTKVKAFDYGRRQQQRRGSDNSSPVFRRGELKISVTDRWTKGKSADLYSLPVSQVGDKKRAKLQGEVVEIIEIM